MSNDLTFDFHEKLALERNIAAESFLALRERARELTGEMRNTIPHVRRDNLVPNPDDFDAILLGAREEIIDRAQAGALLMALAHNPESANLWPVSVAYNDGGRGNDPNGNYARFYAFLEAINPLDTLDHHILNHISNVITGDDVDVAGIQGFVELVRKGVIDEALVGAWLMAVTLNGLPLEATVALTRAVAESGIRLDPQENMPNWGYFVDKHSLGGVGDKKTLILAPLMASLGIGHCKLSGDGLGWTGGTTDKFRSFGCKVDDMSPDEFYEIANRVGCAVAHATQEIAPVDGRLYAIRDVTDTVDSIPLIVASILGKKLAGGNGNVVLNITMGGGSNLDEEQAREFAELAVRLGNELGMNVTAVLTDMRQPLGRSVGNILEVEEAIEILSGGGALDLRLDCIDMAVEMALESGAFASDSEARTAIEVSLASGGALEKFKEMVGAQEGHVDWIDDPMEIPVADYQATFTATQNGYIKAINSRAVGLAVVELGGGRKKSDDEIDGQVGVVFILKRGDAVDMDQAVFTVHYNDPARMETARPLFVEAIEYCDDPADVEPAFETEVIRFEDFEDPHPLLAALDAARRQSLDTKRAKIRALEEAQAEWDEAVELDTTLIEIKNALLDLRDGKITVHNGIERALAFTDRMPELMPFDDALHAELTRWQNQGILACAANMGIYHRQPEQLQIWVGYIVDAIEVFGRDNVESEIQAIIDRFGQVGVAVMERLPGLHFDRLAVRLLRSWVESMNHVGLSTEQRRQVYDSIPWTQETFCAAFISAEEREDRTVLSGELTSAFGMSVPDVNALIEPAE